MRERMRQVMELFDAPYRVTWSKGATLWVARFFSVGAKLDYHVHLSDVSEHIPDGRTMWMISFGTEKTGISPTEKGDAPRVLATVLEVLRQLVREKNPNMIGFKAQSFDLLRLYNSMMDRFLPGSGFKKVGVADAGLDTDVFVSSGIVLIRESAIHEATAAELRADDDRRFLKKAERVRELSAVSGTFFESYVHRSGTLTFKTPSAHFSENGLVYAQTIKLLEIHPAIKKFSAMSSGTPWLQIAVREAMFNGDIRCHCTCPAWKFWGWQYIGTQDDFATRSENRFPIERNPSLRGTVCKHLHQALQVLPFNAGNVMMAIREQAPSRFKESFEPTEATPEFVRGLNLMYPRDPKHIARLIALMRGEKPVNEALDNPYPYALTQKNSRYFTADFLTENGRHYVVDLVRINDPKDVWDIQFYDLLAPSIGVGGGDQFRIMATVRKVVQDFIAKRRPGGITFSGVSDKHSALYSIMVRSVGLGDYEEAGADMFRKVMGKGKGSLDFLYLKAA